MRRAVLCSACLGVLLLSPPLLAQLTTPTVRSVKPLGVGAGQSATLEIRGADLDRATEIRFEDLDAKVESIERFSGELSKVLDYIEKISELDLEAVPPTSHVIKVENALRADESRPSLPRDAALASAPDAALGGFRVPSPGAAP